MKRRGRSPVRVVVFIAICAAIAWGGWAIYNRFARPVVQVTTLSNGPVVQAFYATGTIQPRREYPIKSNTAGTLVKVLVDKGAKVKAGDVLALVNDPLIQYKVDRSKAELDEQKLRADEKTSPVLTEFDSKILAMQDMLAIANRDLERQKELSKNNAGSSTDTDRATDKVKERWSTIESLKAQRAAKVLELKRMVDVAQAVLDSAISDQAQQTLHAPIDGVVLDRPTSQGTRVAINDIVMRIANVDKGNLVMRAQVDEEDIVTASIGQIVRMNLYAFDKQAISGKVVQIYDEADKDRRTFEVDVAFDDPNLRLSPGMTGELAFVIAEKATASVLPSQAMQGEDIYVVKDNHAFKKKPVIGLKSVERIEILSGLDANDQVILSPLGTFSENQQVRTEKIDPASFVKEKSPDGSSGGHFKGFKG